MTGRRDPAQVARQIVALSEAADAEVRAYQVATESEAVVTDRPGADPTQAQIRENAIAHMMMEGVTFTPAGGGPKSAYAIPLPDGTAAVCKSAEPPVSVVITPDNIAEVDAWFARRKRETENELLIAKYGERACRDAGIL